MKITFAEPAMPTAGLLAVGVLEDRELTPRATEVDRATKGALVRAMNASRFRGKKDEVLEVVTPAGVEVSRVLLLGLGKSVDLDELRVQGLGGRVLAHANAVGEKQATIAIDALDGGPLKAAELAANIGFGARLRAYRFDKYRTKEPEEKKPTLATLTIQTKSVGPAETAFERLDRVADGIFMTRDLVSEPANIIFPDSFAQQAKSLARMGIEVEVLDEKDMRKLKMGALLGVGQGSANPPRMVVMQWRGAPRAKETALAVIGKGVTFDTGGISIKPAAGMEDMKWDMAGAGVVVGLMRALAGRKAKVNVVGVCGLVENMPSATAQRPGDIVTSMSGQTIEVINTDAEGRLVLADALWYTQDRFKPKAMIDLATLTGAIIVALGNDMAGLFSNNDELAERLTNAGKAVGEPLWRLPLADTYDKQIESEAADMKNVGNRGAGSITAAQFLQRFVNDVPWAHLDIAGTAWSKKDTPTVPKGGTAFGVRLLDRLIAEHYEGK